MTQAAIIFECYESTKYESAIVGVLNDFCLYTNIIDDYVEYIMPDWSVVIMNRTDMSAYSEDEYEATFSKKVREWK